MVRSNCLGHDSAGQPRTLPAQVDTVNLAYGPDHAISLDHAHILTISAERGCEVHDGHPLIPIGEFDDKAVEPLG